MSMTVRVAITVRVPADITTTRPAVAAAQLLCNVLDHGISAMRHTLPADWSNPTLDPQTGIVTLGMTGHDKQSNAGSTGDNLPAAAGGTGHHHNFSMDGVALCDVAGYIEYVRTADGLRPLQ